MHISKPDVVALPPASTLLPCQKPVGVKEQIAAGHLYFLAATACR